MTQFETESVRVNSFFLSIFLKYKIQKDMQEVYFKSLNARYVSNLDILIEESEKSEKANSESQIFEKSRQSAFITTIQFLESLKIDFDKTDLEGMQDKIWNAKV